MKIRNGFVSNSSSSSFIVAFDKKPKSAEEVKRVLFGDSESIGYYDYDITTEDASSVVFKDICSKKKATLKDIIAQFAGHYHYYTSNNVSWLGRKNDELGGAWIYPINRYYLSDENLMKKLRSLYIESNKTDKELADLERKIFNEQFNKTEPPYAYKGGKDRNGNPYTNEQIKVYNKYEKDLEKFHKTNKDYIAWKAKRHKTWDYYYKKMHDLSLAIAKKDAKNFMEDNKGRHIFITEYSDGNGEIGCVMEHGDIFNNVNHIRISNH